MIHSVSLDVQGQTLLLLPDRALVWREASTVVVADTHFGKSSVFRRHGMAVPAGSDEHDRQRLTRIVRRETARRLFILGDFLHAPLDADGADARDIAAWCESLGDTEIHVVAGNHDRGVMQRWRPPVVWHDADHIEAPFCFTHDAERAGRTSPGRTSPHLFTLSGHIHPVVRIGSRSRPAPRVPVFWQREAGLVLPSFGVFTGGYVVSPGPGDRIYAAGPERVVSFSPSGRC
jgi:DNA ligase-associated metallophosphoesterase